jgi:hypothetical protein
MTGPFFRPFLHRFTLKQKPRQNRENRRKSNVYELRIRKTRELPLSESAHEAFSQDEWTYVQVSGVRSRVGTLVDW